jgi:hypothetical protein
MAHALGHPLKSTTTMKNVPKTNTLAYFDGTSMTMMKSFVRLTPVGNVIKLFTAVSYDFS